MQQWVVSHIRTVIVVGGLLAVLASGALVGWGVQSRVSVELLRARDADSAILWQDYIDRHPQGWDADEARSALARHALVTPVERSSAAAPAPAPVPEAVADAALLRRLEGRIAQLKESIARFDQPPSQPVAVPVTATAPVSQPVPKLMLQRRWLGLPQRWSVIHA